MSEPGETRGAITIHDRVVEKMAARAATEVADVGAAAPRLLGKSLSAGSAFGMRASDLEGVPKASARVDGSFAVVDLEISLRWPCPIREVTESLRAHVRERVHELTALELAEVNVHVLDLVRELPNQSRVR
jgi:uncharacterized alkaline shock family protein YloU